MAVRKSLTGSDDGTKPVKADKVHAPPVMRDKQFVQKTLLWITETVPTELDGERLVTRYYNTYVVIERHREGKPTRYYKIKMQTTG